VSAPIVVVGSGPSGVHAALTLLEAGHQVTLVDVGHPRPEPVGPDLDLNGLKGGLADPITYFLGSEWEALVLPGEEDGEYYGFPPSKQYVFAGPPTPPFRGEGFEPLASFAQGGLAEAWTGGCYPFDADEIADWPVAFEDLRAAYGRVACRIGVSGRDDDDLAVHFPSHDGLQPPLTLDGHGEALLATYEANRARIQRDGCRLGRSRSAVLSRAFEGRRACHESGRCQWGCPTDALYTPVVTLRACRAHQRFSYAAGFCVDHLRIEGSGRVREVVARNVRSGSEEGFAASAVVLAAGALGTAKILLDSVRKDGGEVPELGGLMDNRQVMAPFVNLLRIGRAFEPARYQYHQLAIGYDPGGPRDYVHGLVTTLTTALVHPIVQSLPFSMATSLGIFRSLHGALGLLNVNFADWRRDTNRVGLEDDGAGGTRLRIQYAPEPGEPERVRHAMRTLRRMLRRMGCFAPPFMTRPRPMGASVHYAGLVPMSEDGGPWTATPEGRCRAFENVWLADGIGFPSLPAKNLTFTLMANATRIADHLGEQLRDGAG
jgi:choline dehydrogenase-like flavoprotein